ncbi:MAG: hypothetical protein QXU67_06615, partial [Candidatus Bathyarchaeia archaeon]
MSIKYKYQLYLVLYNFVIEVVALEKKGHIKMLKCRECGKEYPPIKIHACEDCFGPLEVVYNLDSIKVNKHIIKKRDRTLWRYHELLPIEDKAKIVDLRAGFTPLQECRRLAETLG